MAEWIHWFAYNAPIPPVENLTADHKWVIENGLHRIEQRSGTKFTEGSNPKASPILLTLDQVNIVGRPAFWYVTVALAHWAFRKYYIKCHNAKFAKYRGLE